MAQQIPKTVSTVIIRMDRMRYLDQSGLYTFEVVLIDLKNKGITVLFVHVLEQPKYRMERVKLIPSLIPRDQIFDNFEQCTSAIINVLRGNLS